MGNRIILIDKDPAFGQVMADKLEALGYHNLVVVDNPVEAAKAFERSDVFDLALIDTTMTGIDGQTLLELIKNTSPGTECIMISTLNDSGTAVECLRKGAYDYLVKPVAKSVLAITLPKALERKRLLDILDMEKRRGHGALTNPQPFAPILTRSPVMQRVLKEAELHAASDVPILITGESGTGKELLAWAIHAASPRSSFPFTPINMASISSILFEAEFFDQQNGTLLDSGGTRSGVLEHVHRGTLFLNEIGDLSMELQGKLLEILQKGEFSRMGGRDRIQVNLRFIAATNEDLDSMMARNVFRKDLYYRIRGGWLHLPALRDRPEDIDLLVNTFLEKYRPSDQKSQPITQRALSLLSAYQWPGNVRELKSVLKTAVTAAQGSPIEPCHLPELLSMTTGSGPEQAIPGNDKDILPLAELERIHILKIYDRLGRNKSKTARVLGIGLNTLRRKLTEYGRT